MEKSTTAFIRDVAAQFLYPVPTGWERADVGEGPTSGIAPADVAEAEEGRKATVLAGVLEEAPGRDPATAALQLAYGWAQLSDARVSASFADEESRAIEIDGRRGGTASLVATFPGSSSGDLRLRVTLVEVADGYWSYLMGTAHPGAADLIADIDAVHEGLLVAIG
ncbi:hypothetical protein Afil01_65340 [Actinorhabdospora filicis]|uniref:Uncharacterized protein n=1 Tax=Actinorhabdospora filicis TaxID=1785913 RepID=A0A9W6W6N0_9ACTN|nr:hypothetical protein [Actinorhabdospora filicis]GLZ81727.1 hypothetical protein Afil01_65340 [Actinorhabdospora filicis]